MKNFFSFIFLIFSTLVFSQTTDKVLIEKGVKSILMATESKDYDKVLDLSHPKMFEFIDRETLKGFFISAFEGNEEYSIDILNAATTKFNISDVFSQGISKYAFVDYPISMKMKFKNENFDEEQQKMMEVDGMKVEFLDDQTLIMTKLGMMIAINDKSTKNEWKFINHDENNEYYAKLVPIKIITKAKDYYSDLLKKEKEDAN